MIMGSTVFTDPCKGTISGLQRILSIASADLPTIFACTLGPRVQNAWKMYPMLGIERRILSSRASNQFVGFIDYMRADSAIGFLKKKLKV